MQMVHLMDKHKKMFIYIIKFIQLVVTLMVQQLNTFLVSIIDGYVEEEGGHMFYRSSLD